jgi:hypothetical protein
LIGRVQPVHRVLLLVLYAPNPSEHLFQVRVIRRTGVAMHKDCSLVLDAIHQYHATARERVDLLLTVGGLGDLFPGAHLLLERNTFFAKRIQFKPP